ncbi:MAG: PEP-CTERM sorting domain-containing protein [Pirellulales bacterium]|nr:PEP-CTERM sorting domain-containing protein [Pirellulales bacterium]
MSCRLAGVALACVCGLCGVTGAQAATSLSDPLTSFNGGNFTVSGNDPVVFDAAGAHFGTGLAGDDGRTYLRTTSLDYANVSFVAEITFELSSATVVDDNGTPNDPADDTTSVVGDSQAVFFGLGAGERALFGTPDWSTLFSSASFWPETGNDKFTRFRTANDINSFSDTTVAGFAPGVHRFRMTFNAANRQLLGEIDLNYAGGPFVADPVGSNFPIVTSSLFAADGWPSEPASIFFGGDDGAILRDISVRVVPEPAAAAMLLIGAAAIAAARRRARS